MKKGVILKAVEPEDVDFMMECESDREASKWSDYRAPFSRRMLMDYAVTYDADPFAAGQLRLIACDPDGRKVGIGDLYGISEKDARAETGIYIHPAFRNNGFGEATLEALVEFCRNRLGLYQLTAKISTENTAALNLFRKSGFKEIAILPSWHKIGKCLHDITLFTFPL